jgi:hypothetical protein
MKNAAAKYVLPSGVLLLLVALSHPAACAQPSAIAPGDRIRITTTRIVGSVVRSSSIVGTFVRSSSDSLLLATETREVMIPRHTVQSVEVRTGQKTKALAGGLIGAALGGLAFALLESGAEEKESSGISDMDLIGLPTGPVINVFYFGLIGGAVGALIGSRFRSDRWERVSIEASVGLMGIHPNGAQPVPGLRVRLRLL